MRKCALATERRMFVPPPTGWQVADIFVSVPRVHQFSTGLKTEWFSSKAFLASLFGCAARPAVKCTNGAPACMDRPRTRIARSKTAKRLDVVCSGQSRSRHDCPNRYPESHGPL